MCNRNIGSFALKRTQRGSIPFPSGYVRLMASSRTQPFDMVDASKLGVLLDLDSMLKEATPKKKSQNVSNTVHVEYSSDYWTLSHSKDLTATSRYP